MGCENVERLHRFPKDPERRAQWFRIFGKKSNLKSVFACSQHFAKHYIYGNTISNYAIPHIVHPELEADVAIKTEIKEEYTLHDNEGNQFSTDNANESERSQDTNGKVEDFEIRKKSTNDMIIKGRFVQTNNYLVVSYTPPKKWSLQNQIKYLDEHCERQLKQIKQLNKENWRLKTELKKFDKLLPKLRFLQTNNRFLNAELRMYKNKEKQLKKRKKEKRLKNKTDVTMLVDNSTEA